MQQNRKQKEAVVAEVAKNVKASKALVFANFKGVAVKDITAIRKELKTSGSSWRVLKKTLLSLALKDAGVDMNAGELPGQIGVAFSADEVAAAKVLSTYMKSHPEVTLTLEGGVLGTKKLSAAEVKALSKIPGTQELRGMLVGVLAGPMSGFVRTLNGNLLGLVQVLKAASEKKTA